ncbi:hypothetical protein, partial [Vreelandella neptunia]
MLHFLTFQGYQWPVNRYIDNNHDAQHSSHKPRASQHTPKMRFKTRFSIVGDEPTKFFHWLTWPALRSE